MTAEYFDDNINDFLELITFCCEEECEIGMDIRSQDDLDSVIFEDISESSSHLYWFDVRSRLNNIYDEQYGEWFIYNGEFDYTFIGDDQFEDYKHRVFQWAMETGRFEAEESVDSGGPFEWESELIEFGHGPVVNEDVFEVADLNILLAPA